MYRRRPSVIFFSAVAMTVGLLAALPQPSWLVRQEMRYAAGTIAPSPLRSNRSQSGADASERAVATAHPDDFPIQLAFALRSALRDSNASAEISNPSVLRSASVRALLPLRAHFDNKPELHAHILRYLTQADLKLHRDEGGLLRKVRPSEKKGNPSKERPSTPAGIALALESSTRGEALDPKNGFFPMMSAIALMESHRDTEALDALHRAAACPNWDDYAGQEPRANWTLTEAAHGRSNGLRRVVIAAAVLFPHYAGLRELARVSTALAMEKESAGDREAGFTIRQDVMRVGATMRTESRVVIGSLVGAAITSIASSRPDGAEVLERQAGESDTALSSRQMSRFVAYLTRIGHPDDAAYYISEVRSSEKMKGIIRHAEESSLFGLQPLYWLAGEYLIGTALLVYAFWILFFGGIASLLGRTSRIREGQPMHKAVRCGAILTPFLLPLFIVGGLAIAPPPSTTGGDFVSDSAVIASVALGVLMLLITAFCLKRGETFRGFARNTGICTATVGTLTLIALLPVLADISLSHAAGPLAELYALTCSSSDGGANQAAFNQALLLIAGVFFAPIITMLAYTVRSRRQYIPSSVGIVRGFRTSALPIASVLLLLFVAMVGVTLVQEQNVQRQLDGMLSGEGRYSAALVHDEWPGKTEIAPVIKHP